MSFTWRTFVELAEHLIYNPLQGIDNEATLRSSISRSYYGAYNSAAKLINDKHMAVLPKTAEAHQLVSKTFLDSGKRDLRKAGFKLIALKKKRWDADYEYIPTTNFAAEAVTAVKEANDVCDIVDANV